MNDVLAAAADPLAAPLARYLLHGDEAGMEEVVARTRPRLLAAAARIGSPSDADDAVQAAYLSLVRRRGTLLDAPVLPWLLTATIRCAYRRKAIARRESALAERLSRLPREAPEAEDAPDLARVRCAVARLPQRYRDVVVLCDLLGLSPAEAAPLLDLSPSTARVRLHRGRRLVRSRFAPRFVAAWLAIPWFLAGRGRDASLSTAALAAGGLVTGPVVAVVGVVAVVAGVAIGRWVLPPAAPPAEDARAAETAAQVRSLKEQVARLEEAARAAKAATLAEASRPEAAPAPTVSPRPGPDAAAGGAPAVGEAAAGMDDARKARFAIPGKDDVLKDIDWKGVGDNLSGMVPLIAEMADHLATGKSPSIQAQGKIMKLNGGLVEAATTLEEKWKTGNANTAFTHPAFMANAIAAALEAAGRPLTDDQARGLGRLGVSYTEEEARRLAGYGDRTLALQKTIEEADLRDRFFADAFAILTEEQRAALGTPATRGRLSLDLFSSGLVWSLTASPVTFTSRDDLAADVEKAILDHQKPLASAKETVHAAVLEWANALPKDVLEAPADPLSAMRMMTVAQTTAAAKRQVALTQRLLDTVSLTEEGAKAVRGWTHVLVPVKK